MEWHAQDVLEGLMTAGVCVSVLTTPLPAQPCLRELRPNGTLLTLGNRAGAYDPLFAWEVRTSIAEFVRRHQIDLVHAQGFAGLLVPRSVASITTIHGTLWSETPLRGARPTLGQLWRYKHRFAFAPVWHHWLSRNPALTVDSQFSAEELEREIGSAPKRLRVVPLGFDLSRFAGIDRAQARREFGASDGELLLAWVGRFEATKRAEWAIRAAQALPSGVRWRLILAGLGPEREGLREKYRHAAGNILFPGRVSSERLASLITAADLFLNPDAGAPAFGLANAEALVCGTPVLTTDSGAHREVVADPDDGRLVPVADEQAWNAALAAMATEHDLGRSDRRARALLCFERSRMIGALTGAYRDVLSGGL
jgi:glycosyltransferase involved in cell wall biosynthesis